MKRIDIGGSNTWRREATERGAENKWKEKQQKTTIAYHNSSYMS